MLLYVFEYNKICAYFCDETSNPIALFLCNAFLDNNMYSQNKNI
jgi:hemolysin-activating ACP:hemolysin acyltransferase